MILIKENTNYIWFNISECKIMRLISINKSNEGWFQFYKITDKTVLSCNDDIIHFINLDL
jgi:hypothetical protein